MLVDAHPTRERLVGQLMLALYRGGQPAAALDVLHRTRTTLADELGLDPGPELQRLELAILRNDPALARPEHAATAANTVRLDVPALLPPGIADFTGRDEHLRRLDEDTAGGDAVVISAIAGAAGVGKTALALQWAHRARPRFPDGQLYVNLDGFAIGPPLRPEQVLFQFLRALGVPTEQIPSDLTEAAGRYRTVLADRHVLVVLDNAATAEQVRPLLPASPSCAVLVTSRNRLDGLVAINAARRINLDVLPADEAVDLLARIIGRDRIAAEPEAAAELARATAFLPLALRIAGASLANQPARTIAAYLTELNCDPLGALELDEDTAVRSTFDLSYGTLKPDVRRVFRLMGIAPGLDISVEAIAAMAELPAPRARTLLNHLATTHLVDQSTYGRYTFHDLLREYARETALATDADQDREAALDRLFLHYRRTALGAVESVYPANIRLTRSTDLPDPVTYGDATAALSWLDAERANLVAVVEHAQRHGHWRVVWELSDTIRAYFGKSAFFVEWRIVATAALAAAEADGDPRAVGTAHFNLANAAGNRYAEAQRHYLAALSRYEETGWLHGQAAAHNNLGMINEDAGWMDLATEHQSRALALARRGGLVHNEVSGLNNLGLLHIFRGELTEAADCIGQALELAREIGAEHGVGFALGSLGSLTGLQGRFEQARELCEQAYAIYHRDHATSDESLVRTYLSTVLNDGGQPGPALVAGRQAVELSLPSGDRRLQARAWLAVAAARTALGEDAGEDYRHALALTREFGARYEECRALIGLREGVEALDLARRHGFRLLEGEALAVLAETGDPSYAAQALAVFEATGHEVGRRRLAGR